MRELIEQIFSLQRSWSHANTPEMKRRGLLIRDAIPERLKEEQGLLASAMGLSGKNLDFQGRDGTGQKTEVPWVRFCSKTHSPNAREGWYCVYLFHAKGAGVYLTLMHASTRWVNGEFKPRPQSELEDLVKWAKTVLAPELANVSGLEQKIDLGAKGRLGEAYEKSTVACIWYSADAMPDDARLFADAVAFARLLGMLYDADDLGRSPDSIEQEALAAQSLIRSASSIFGGEAKGQGFGLTLAERMAVERYAVKVAHEHLSSKGYQVRDVSSTRPYDFIAAKDGTEIIVEVKGTTGNAKSIILTANEVEAHAESHPRNALIIVHSIELDRKADPPRASGGKRVTISPWAIDRNFLRSLSYQYIPKGGFSETWEK